MSKFIDLINNFNININIKSIWPLFKLVIISQNIFYYIGSLISYLHLNKLDNTIMYDSQLIYNL